MLFDPENHIIKLCADGMLLEGEGKAEEAAKVFHRAWNEATNDVEKFTGAHYIARHQKSVADKLKWDETAMSLALKVSGDEIKGAYPSLYLNIAKCHEDLNDFEQATENYNLALSFANYLQDDGYGNMIKAGIANGLQRVKKGL